MEPEGSSPSSQQLVTGAFPEPFETSPYPISLLFILLLSSYIWLGFQSGPFPSGFPIKTFVCSFHLSHACCSPWFDQSVNIWWRVQIIKLLIVQVLPLPLLPLPLVLIFFLAPCSQTSSAMLLHRVRNQVLHTHETIIMKHQIAWD